MQVSNSILRNVHINCKITSGHKIIQGNAQTKKEKRQLKQSLHKFQRLHKTRETKERTNWASLNKQLPKQLLRNLQETQKTEK